MILIAAADARWGIGKAGKLLMSIPEDMKFFQTTTTGHTVIMGRKTLESFPGGKPLKNRQNIVLTRQTDYAPGNVEITHSVQETLDLIKNLNPDDVFCIGGAEIYNLFLPHCDKALITKIHRVFNADAFLPDLDTNTEWHLVKESNEQTYSGIPYRFCEYNRIH